MFFFVLLLVEFIFVSNLYSSIVLIFSHSVLNRTTANLNPRINAGGDHRLITATRRNELVRQHPNIVFDLSEDFRVPPLFLKCV